MPYLDFRFIAYEVPTVIKVNGKTISGFDPGDPCDPVARIPVNTTPDSAEAKNKLLRLASVVKIAADWVRHNTDDETVLKVFVVPEFYFRPPISYNQKDFPYNTYSYEEAVEILAELNVMFTHGDFAHWLIVAGTVLWHWDDMDRGDSPSTSPQGRSYRNTAIYIRGGRTDSLRAIEKHVPSHMDGVPNPYKPGIDAYDSYLQEQFENWHFRKDHIFEIDGVRCGLEVCLDHANAPGHRVLKTILADWATNERVPPPELHLHILAAGGMGIQSGSVGAKIDGHILRNDGFVNLDVNNSGRSLSELRKIKAYSSLGAAELGPALVAAKVIPLTAPQALSIPPIHPGDFQRLVIYRAQELPQ